MGRIWSWAVLAVAVGTAMLGAGGAAFADSITPSAPTITPLGGGLFQWSYVLSIDSAEFIPTQSGSTQPCTTTGTAGVETECAFFTFFDVQGLTGTPTFTSSITNFGGTVTTPLLGPAAFLAAVPDNPSIPNVDVAFVNNTGSSVTNAGLGTLAFDSTFGAGGVGFFSAQSNLESSSHVGGNQSTTLLPAPEPSTLSLFGLGMLVPFGGYGLGFLRRRRRRRDA